MTPGRRRVLPTGSTGLSSNVRQSTPGVPSAQLPELSLFRAPNAKRVPPPGAADRSTDHRDSVRGRDPTFRDIRSARVRPGETNEEIREVSRGRSCTAVRRLGLTCIAPI